MSEIAHSFDIVIIGSGAGGGTVAKELAPLCSKGLKIAVLEYGGRFLKEDNTRLEIEMARKYYFEGGAFQTQSQDMTLAFAHGVGGTTNVYTGVTFKLPEHVLRTWDLPDLPIQDLHRRMEKYIKECHVHLQPPENINRNNQLFKMGAESLGWETDQFPLNIKDCEGLNTCNLGCPRHAKQGTAVVQLPVAEKMGVEIISFCRVSHIEGSEILAEVAPAHGGLQESSWPVGRHRIKATRIIVCAGAVHTPAILMRSFGRSFNPVIGRYFTCHPALMLAAEHPTRVDGTLGHPKSYYCDRFVESHNFLLETCMYFPFSLAKNLTGFGPQLDELMHRYEYLQMILTLVLDEALPENCVSLDRKGQAQVHYNLSQRIRQSFVESIKASARIFFAAGANRAHLPGTKDFFTSASQVDDLDQLVSLEEFKPGKVSISAAHLMGGCRMGTNPTNSVTDSWGRIHGKKNIYVADASLFPACSRVNPYLTIMALADRVAEGVRSDLH